MRANPPLLRPLTNGAISRRQAIQWIAASGATLTGFSFVGCATRKLLSAPPEKDPLWRATSPIDREIAAQAQAGFSGDNPEVAHSVLWNKQRYLDSIGGAPPITEHAPVVVIGGGMSGLLSAYKLRDLAPIVLERAERFGGNSRGESWNGIDYSIGAAYIGKHDQDSNIGHLCRELGVDRKWRTTAPDGRVEYKGKIVSPIWSGATDTRAKAQFQRIWKHLHDTFYEQNGLFYPEMPVDSEDSLSRLRKLDEHTFQQHLEKIARGTLHRHVRTYFEHYCWSSFGASMSEIGAAQGLYFCAAELDGAHVLPGGNAAIAESVVRRLWSDLPEGNLRAGCVVFDVECLSEGVRVSYLDPNKVARSILARSVIAACPKFVTAKIIRGLESERLHAISSIQYRSYLVANLLIDGEVDTAEYDLFLMGDGDPAEGKVTDIVFGGFACPDQRNYGVLTLYRPMPSPSARPLLLMPDAYDRHKKEFEAQIDSSVLPLLKIERRRVRDLRLTRWGHPFPVARRGLLSDATLEQLRKPFQERVFFAEQDNWCLPAFETCVYEAERAAKMLRKTLG